MAQPTLAGEDLACLADPFRAELTIQVVTLAGPRVAPIVSFDDPGLVTMFGLPQVPRP